jgi:hypothetical protein
VDTSVKIQEIQTRHEIQQEMFREPGKREIHSVDSVDREISLTRRLETLFQQAPFRVRGLYPILQETQMLRLLFDPFRQEGN